MRLKVDLHDIYSEGSRLERALTDVMQEAVDKGACLSLTAEEDEEVCPCQRLDDMREPDDSKENDGKDFNRSFHLALTMAALASFFLESCAVFRRSMSVERLRSPAALLVRRRRLVRCCNYFPVEH